MRDKAVPQESAEASRLERVARALRRLDPPLERIAHGWLGLESRIDLLARDPRGQLVLVLLARSGEDLERFADALAQCAWAAPRIADWLQIAPEIGVRAELGVRAWLLAPRFDPRTRAAASTPAGDAVTLALWVGDEADEVRVENAGPDEGGAPAVAERRGPAAGPGTTRSVFRTGLRPSDL